MTARASGRQRQSPAYPYCRASDFRPCSWLWSWLAFSLPSSFLSLDKWPADWVIPARDWVTAAFAWFAVVAKPVTRAISWVLAQPLAFAEALLYRGLPDFGLASAALGFDRGRNRNPRALGWRPTTSALLRSFRPLSCSLRPMVRCHADLGDRRGDGAACRRDWPSLRHMGNAQRPGGARLERNLRRDAGNAAHGLSGTGRRALRLRASSGNAGDDRLRRTTHGALHNPRHSHRSLGHHRGWTNGRVHAATVALESRVAGGREDTACWASTRLSCRLSPWS